MHQSAEEQTCRKSVVNREIACRMMNDGDDLQLRFLGLECGVA